MFMSALPILVAFLSSASAITINTPTGWQGNSTNVVTWTSTPSDPPLFSIELVADQFHPSIGIANNVETALGSLGIPLTRLDPGPGFTLQFVNVTDINDVFATSGSFSIAEHDVNGNSTSGVPSITAASTAPGTPGAAPTDSNTGTATAPITSPTDTGASTNTGSSSNTAVPSTFTGAAQKCVSLSGTLFGAVLGWIVLVN